MALRDVKDLVIRYPGHPKYQPDRIIEDDEIEVIVQKLEMILFTNKGEVLGDIDIGVNNCSGNVIINDYCGVGANTVIMPNNYIPEGVAVLLSMKVKEKIYEIAYWFNKENNYRISADDNFLQDYNIKDIYEYKDYKKLAYYIHTFVLDNKEEIFKEFLTED